MPDGSDPVSCLSRSLWLITQFFRLRRSGCPIGQRLRRQGSFRFDAVNLLTPSLGGYNARRSLGVSLNCGTENKPLEPDPGCTGVGNASQPPFKFACLSCLCNSAI